MNQKFSKRFKVDLWCNTTGQTPETTTSVVVEAEDKFQAVQLARKHVRLNYPDRNPMQLDTWFTEELFET